MTNGIVANQTGAISGSMSGIGIIQSVPTVIESIEGSSPLVRLSASSSRYPSRSSSEFSYIGPRPTSPYFQLPVAVREVGNDIGAFIFSTSRLCSTLPCWSQNVSSTVKSKEPRGARKQNKHTVMLSLESTAVIDMPVVQSEIERTFTAEALVNTPNKSYEKREIANVQSESNPCMHNKSQHIYIYIYIY